MNAENGYLDCDLSVEFALATLAEARRQEERTAEVKRAVAHLPSGLLDAAGWPGDEECAKAG